MKILLLLNLFIEGIVGLIFILNPSFLPIFSNADLHTLYIVRMYGFAAVTMAYLSLQILIQIHVQELLVTGLLVFILFHFSIGMAQLTHLQAIEVTLPAAILHFVFALAFLFYYLKER